MGTPKESFHYSWNEHLRFGNQPWKAGKLPHFSYCVQKTAPYAFRKGTWDSVHLVFWTQSLLLKLFAYWILLDSKRLQPNSWATQFLPVPLDSPLSCVLKPDATTVICFCDATIFVAALKALGNFFTLVACSRRLLFKPFLFVSIV